MKDFWRSKSSRFAALIVCCLHLQNLSFCLCLNDEGVALLRFKENLVSDPHGALSNWIDEVGVENPCAWFGVGCSDGHVVTLRLKDLRLKGTVAPDIGNLVHVKSIILRNNSFSGVVPTEIANLKELEVLDIGYNNFSGQLPCHLGNNLSMAILLLDNNELLCITHPEIYELQKLSEVQVEEDLLSSTLRASSCNGRIISWNSGNHPGEVARRKLLQEALNPRRPSRRVIPPLEPITRNSPSPAPSLSPSTAPPSSSPTPSHVPLAQSPSTSTIASISPPSLSTPTEAHGTPTENSRKNSHSLLILSTAIGGPLLLLVLMVGIFFYKRGKVATVQPWATGLSGQLRRAFVTGVPKLNRFELEAACEDFSNVIGSSSVCTLYKGTLSSGVEIAVASIAVASAKGWTTSLESQFRKKIDTLSKVNHKNFVSLLGYCEEEEPFTRMMVFEYASNGTLFEHIHMKEAEHLDWVTRMRIAMGIAYCLEHMHQLAPVVALKNLTSSSVYLTEDYATKLADFVFYDDAFAAETEPNPLNNVYNFGVVLFEMVTGRLPYSVGNDSVEDWASDYLKGVQPHLKEMVDPTLETYQENQLQLIDGLIKSCVNPDPRQRPTMNHVCARLREIMGIEPEGAIPKSSPLWWAEVEILSTEGN